MHPDLLDLRTLRAKDLAVVEELLARGVAQGELALVGAMHMWLQLWLDGHPLDTEFEQSVLSLYLYGVHA